MDNKAVRKRNVEFLAGQLGGVTEFAKRLDREQPQVSQWLGGKNIGDRLARDIERRLKKPAGWLDQPQWGEAPASHPGRIDVDILLNADEVLELMEEIQGAGYPPKQRLRELAAAYNAAVEDGGKISTRRMAAMTEAAMARRQTGEGKDGRTEQTKRRSKQHGAGE